MAKCLGECFTTYGGIVQGEEDSMLYEYVVCVYCGHRVDRLIPMKDTSKTPFPIKESVDDRISKEFERESKGQSAIPREYVSHLGGLANEQ